MALCMDALTRISANVLFRLMRKKAMAPCKTKLISNTSQWGNVSVVRLQSHWGAVMGTSVWEYSGAATIQQIMVISMAAGRVNLPAVTLL